MEAEVPPWFRSSLVVFSCRGRERRAWLLLAAAVADKGLTGNEKDGTLTLFNAANTAVATWTLTGAVITGLTVNTIGVEHGAHLDLQATFDCDKIERTK